MTERRGKFRFGLKAKIFFYFGTIALALILFSTWYTYLKEKNAFMDGLEQKLVAAAYAVDGMLPAGYHEGIEDANSVSDEDYANYIETFNGVSEPLGLEYIYSYMKFGDELITTSSSFPQADLDYANQAAEFLQYGDRSQVPAEEWEKAVAFLEEWYGEGYVPEDQWAALEKIKESIEFFYLYEEPSDALFQTFETPIGEPVFDLYDDPEYGFLLSAFIPLETESGKRYVIGADIEASYIKDILRQTLTTCLWAGAGFVLLFLGATYISVASISRPVLNLLKTARSVSEDQNFSRRAEKVSDDELGELVDGFNEMLGEIEVRDEKLARHRDHLESEVEKRTAELVELNHDLEAATLSAQQANNAKSAFLASMSHELRTPLNAVIGYSEMLEEEAEDEGLEDFIPDLKKINSAGKHLLSLINNVLDLSKIEAGKMTLYNEWIDLPEMVQEVTDTILPLVEKSGNNLEVRCPEDAGRMYSDLTKIRQTLFNLLSNSAKFTKDGTLGLEISRRTGEGGEDEIVMAVTDSGIGMTEEQIDRLFTAFTQADNSTTRHYGGTGLGLAISKQFCQMLGGDIEVTSEVNKGSTFTVYLPAVFRETEVEEEMETAAPGEASPEVENAAAEVKKTAGQEKGLVLVIDDEENVRDLVSRNLTKAGFTVETASNGKAGLEKAKQLRPAIITLDVMMPGMDGWAVLSSLKSDPDLEEIPVVMMTMLDEKRLGFSLGASEYLTKPVDSRALTRLIRKYQDSQGPYALVVEDDASSRELLCRQLEKEGWEHREAENGREALDQISEHGSPAFILLDLMMPVMNGIQFVEELHRDPDHRNVPIIVITGKEITDEERAALNGDVLEIIKKGDHRSEALLEEVSGLIRDTTETEATPSES